MRFRFSRPARRDLLEIGEYIGRDNPMRAVTFVDEIADRCRGLITFPLSGSPRPSFGPDARIVPFGRYVIVYVVHGDLLEIKRIVHCPRDLPRHF